MTSDKILVVIDVQNDFVTGSLGSTSAAALRVMRSCQIDVIHDYTLDIG